jgi:hypothetical protein
MGANYPHHALTVADLAVAVAAALLVLLVAELPLVAVAELLVPLVLLRLLFSRLRVAEVLE